VGKDTVSREEIHKRKVEHLDRGKTALVVEDRQYVRQSLEIFLGQLGYVVASAPCVEEAVEALGGSNYDLMLIDAQLTPGQFDGIELMERTLDTHKDMKVVLVTGYLEQIGKVDPRVYSIIPKPFTLEQLTNAIA